MSKNKWSEIGMIIGPVLLCPILLFILLHSTPNIAIRTHVFFSGHPIIALTTEIDEQDNNYSLSNPPLNEITGYTFQDYKVKQFGFLNFAYEFSKI